MGGGVVEALGVDASARATGVSSIYGGLALDAVAYTGCIYY
jgi:hypothetical protein